MATMPMLPGASGTSGVRSAGVSSNLGGLNQFSPGGGSITGGARGTSSLPGMGAASTGIPPNPAQTPPFMPSGVAGSGIGGVNQMNRIPAPTALASGGGATTATAPSAVSGMPTPTTPPASQPTGGAGGTTPLTPQQQQQQQQLNKQLTDIYGKGTGGALASLINNLGSGDSEYLQAYQNAMAKQESEGLSTIGTSLGNAGISADSSTSAIEKADYMSGVTSQIGLQEQQLLSQETQQKSALLQSTQGAAAQETGTSWLDTLGQVVDIGSTIAGDVATGGLSGAVSGMAKSIFGGSAPGAIPGGGSASQLPGSFGGGPPPMPSGIPYTSLGPGF